jgi:beta-1,4-mannosyl-glycoprotein beta-1,4-N-acetylglucosaminyltransferase
MIVDCFMFFNEFDILEGRLEYLYPHVDYFVLVEANITHGGDPKPMRFMQNMSRYKPYLDKVLYFPFVTRRDDYDFSSLPTHDRDYNTGPWQLENAQRNHIGKTLELFDDDATVMISDLDEIPHKDCIAIAQRSFSNDWQAFGIQQDHFAYNFNQKLDFNWIGTAIAQNRFVRQQSPQGVRNNRYGFPVIFNGGWHLTYWGDVDAVRAKVQAFAHQELNQDQFKDPDHIKRKIQAGEDLFDRPNNRYVAVDPTSVPEDIRTIFGRYSQRPSEPAQ